MRLILAGVKGVGKTTLGREVSEKLGIPFIDIDEEIAKIAGCDTLFQQSGEEAFRAFETCALQRVKEEAPLASVIALGGGSYLLRENQRIIKALGRVVVLHMSKEALLKRWAKWPSVCKSAEEFDLYFEKRVKILVQLSPFWVNIEEGEPLDVIEELYCSG